MWTDESAVTGSKIIEKIAPAACMIDMATHPPQLTDVRFLNHLKTSGELIMLQNNLNL